MCYFFPLVLRVTKKSVHVANIPPDSTTSPEKKKKKKKKKRR